MPSRHSLKTSASLVASILVALSVSSTTGCSFAIMERVPHAYGPQHLEEPRCTAVKGWPLMDALLAVGGVAGTVQTARSVGASELESYRGPLVVGAIVSGLIAGAFGTSAWMGNGWANECRAARRTKDANVERAGRVP